MKSPKIWRPMTDEERALWQAREQTASFVSTTMRLCTPSLDAKSKRGVMCQ